MTTTTAEVMLRQVLEAVPELLRADRPASSALSRVTELARAVFGTRFAGAMLLEEDGSPGPTNFAGIPHQPSNGSARAERRLLSRLAPLDGVLRLDDAGSHPAFGAPQLPMTTLLGVRLRDGSRTLGVLYVGDRVDGHPFSREDEEVADALGASVGAALANATLLRDALRDRAWMRASTAMTRELLSVDVDEPLGLISDRARELAEADMVLMLLREGDRMRIRYAGGLGAESRLLGRTYSATEAVTARVLGSGQSEVIADLARADEPVALRRVGSVDLGPAMLVPLHGATEVLGALFLCRHEGARRFTEADLETAGTFADHAAVTLELAAAREVAEKLRFLEERNRIARDLHDHVIQRLYATGMSLQQVLPSVDERARARIEVGITTLDDTIRQIRNTILTLRSPEEGSSTLGTLIGTIAREAAPLLGFSPVVALEPPAAEVSGALAADLAACIREGLSNIVRHARAKAVEVHAEVEHGELRLVLRDDGVGIRSSRRSGLANLRTRAERNGGTLEVTSPLEGGTQLTWRVPLAPDG